MALTLMKMPMASTSFTCLHCSPCPSSKSGMTRWYARCEKSSSGLAGFLAQRPVHCQLRKNALVKQEWQNLNRTKHTGTRIHAEPGQEGSDGAPSESRGSTINVFAQPRFWLQGVIAIATLGFLDAGYSGDWSRIGFISPEFEQQLRQLAFIVCPAAAFVIWVLERQKAST